MLSLRRLSCTVVLSLLTGASFAQSSYKVRDLDPAAQLLGGYAFQTNSAKVSVGGGATAGPQYFVAARFDASGVTILPELPGDEAATAYDINDAGVIVGVSTDVVQQHQLTLFTDHPVIWKNGQTIDLRTLVTSGPPLELLTALSINEHEQIIGFARDPATQTGRPYLFDHGVVTDLGALPATPFSGANANHIGDDGRVVGSSASNGGFAHAVVWQNGQITDLHASAQIPGRVSHAEDSNRFGVIVGSADYGADFLDYETATVWVNGQATDLGTLAGPGAPPVIESFARAINDLGTIVGVSITPSFAAHAFLVRDGVMTDLNTLIPSASGWILTNAYDIDNDSRIVGEGFLNNQTRPFVLIPNCNGTFEVYGTACPVATGPVLRGAGCPQGSFDFGLEIDLGTLGSSGLLFLGAGAGAAPIGFGCSLQTLPLLPVQFPVTLDANGEWFVPAKLPASTPAFDLWTQAILIDPAQPFGLATTPGLKLHYVP